MLTQAQQWQHPSCTLEWSEAATSACKSLVQSGHDTPILPDCLQCLETRKALGRGQRQHGSRTCLAATYCPSWHARQWS